MNLNLAELPLGDVVISSYAAFLVQMQRRCTMMRKCVGLMKEGGLFVTNSFLQFRPKEQSETRAFLYIVGSTKSLLDGFGAFSRELKWRYRETKMELCRHKGPTAGPRFRAHYERLKNTRTSS